MNILSKADDSHDELLLNIVNNGHSTEGKKVRTIWKDDKSPAYWKAVFSTMLRYDLSDEFPALTQRPVPIKNCIDELLWIWQKKSNNIHDLNSKIWDDWADETGSIGKAYGYQLRQKHIYREGEYDQVDRVLYDLKNDPMNRRIMTNMYVHSDLHEMGLAPCVYQCIFNVMDNKLMMEVHQRSADMIVAGGWNLLQYAVLQHMFAQVSGLEVGEMVFIIANAHIYDRHMDIAREIISRPKYPAPKFEINPDIKNFYDFRVDDFKFINYQTGPQIKNIPVAV